MKICFIVCVDPAMEKTQMFGIRYMPVWAYTLASHLRKRTNLSLALYDTRVSPEDSVPDADYFFYSALNQDIPSNLSLLSKLKIKFPNAKHVIGGPATTSMKMADRLEVLKEFDGIFIGEGEEDVLPFLERLKTKQDEKQIVYEVKKRFSLAESLPMDFTLLSETFHLYYGGVIEVSRGCPFLCEFCDIRTLPDNNRAHIKPVEVIIEELEQFNRLNITNVLFACDNFIGDPHWAERLCDAMIEFRTRTGHALKAYTWLTINVANHPRLIEKMKRAGFDMFFIGIESFGAKQLLETAKIQNTKFNLPEAIRTIQSNGIVVVAGLIFGFDADSGDTTKEALDGILSSGLISGDPTLLTALAGTPLYRRMQLAGRLREGKVALGGHKYSTNIKYLRPKKEIIDDYIYFVETFNSVSFQIKRYQQFLSCLKIEDQTENKSRGYISPGKIIKLVFSNNEAFIQAFKRVSKFLSSPYRIAAVMYALLLTKKYKGGSWAHFSFWVFNWSNSLVKYDGISAKDFNIESVEEEITAEHILPKAYLDDYFEPIPHAKIKAQRQFTVQSLKQLIAPPNFDTTLVIIPSYSPPEILPKLCLELIQGGLKQILIVNDGSPAEFEKVFEAVKRLGVFVHSLSANQGKGAALRAGIKQALKEFPECTHYIFCDDDGQHASADVIKVAKSGIEKTADFIIGTRDINLMPLKSYIGNQVTRYFFKYIHRINIPDTQSGLRFLSRKSAEIILELVHERFSFELVSLVHLKKQNIKIETRPIQTIYFNGNKLTRFQPITDSADVVLSMLAAPKVKKDKLK